jgi:hypothetical protein
MDMATGKVDTVLKAFNDAKGFAFDETGSQLAFVAERDSSLKSLRKYYKLWYFRQEWIVQECGLTALRPVC